jgi:hypothetical protein
MTTTAAAHIATTFFIEGLLRFLIPEGCSPQEKKLSYIANAMDARFSIEFSQFSLKNQAAFSAQLT